MSLTEVSIAFRRSALRLPGGWNILLRDFAESPLPFGVLPSGFATFLVFDTVQMEPSPLPFGVLPSGFSTSTDTKRRKRSEVSIAFRRSALRLPPAPAP